MYFLRKRKETPGFLCPLFLRLKGLRVLVRGDFLCEALEHMEATLGKDNNILLKLEEFWASEV
jgi:hypothetical protein